MSDETMRVGVFVRNAPPGAGPAAVLPVEATLRDLALTPRVVKDRVAEVLRRAGYAIPREGVQVHALATPAHGVDVAVYVRQDVATVARTLRKRPVTRQGPQGGPLGRDLGRRR